MCLNEGCAEKILKVEDDLPESNLTVSKSGQLSSSSVNIAHYSSGICNIFIAIIFSTSTVRTSSSREEVKEYIWMGKDRSSLDARRLRVFGVTQFLPGGRSHSNSHTHRPSRSNASTNISVLYRFCWYTHPRTMLFIAWRLIITIYT